MKTWGIIIAFAVIVGVLAIFILKENPSLSPLGSDCDAESFEVTPEDISFFGWGVEGKPQVGDFVSGRDCNTPNAQCLAKHRKLVTDNSIYTVRSDGTFNLGTRDKPQIVPSWVMGCTICEDLGIVCECK